MKDNEESPSVADPVGDELTQEQVVLLEVAVEKLVRAGEKAGVTPDEMIALLNSGMDIRELLDYIASKRAEIA
jgi:hypothetical protein